MHVPTQTLASVRPAEEGPRTYFRDTRFAPPVLSVEHSVAPAALPTQIAKESVASNVDELALASPPEQLYAEFRPLVRRLIRQYGENLEIRNDLEGEIYYRFCVLLKAFDPQRGVPLRPYLVRQLSASTYTYVRHHWRNQNREVSLDLFTSDTGPRQAEDPTSDWDNALVLQQVKKALPEAIANLSERQRKVVIWRYYEDRTFEEIAGRLGIQTSTARSLLRHALNHLRGEMAP